MNTKNTTRWILSATIIVAIVAAIHVQLPAAELESFGASRTMEVLFDVSYADTENARQTLDLILPRGTRNAPVPIVVYIHGGAWRGGNKSTGLHPLIDFVKFGHYAAASIGYRLTREAQWPAQIHDCKAAIRWLRANADRLRIDPDRIGVFGHSAGGHLVAMLATSGDVPEMDGRLGSSPDVSSRVACAVDLYGPTNFLTMNRTATSDSLIDHDAPDSPESLLLGAPIQTIPDAVATANPISYVSSDDASCLIIHGTHDRLVPFNQSELLHQALRDKSVRSTLITITGGLHGDNFGVEPVRLTHRFFDHHLRGKSSPWKDRSVPAFE